MFIPEWKRQLVYPRSFPTCWRKKSPTDKIEPFQSGRKIPKENCEIVLTGNPNVRTCVRVWVCLENNWFSTRSGAYIRALSSICQIMRCYVGAKRHLFFTSSLHLTPLQSDKTAKCLVFGVPDFSQDLVAHRKFLGFFPGKGVCGKRGLDTNFSLAFRIQSV